MGINVKLKTPWGQLIRVVGREVCLQESLCRAGGEGRRTGEDQGVGATAKPQSAPHYEVARGGLAFVDGAPRPDQLPARMGAVEALLLWPNRDAHEGVLEVEDDGEYVLFFANMSSQLRQIDAVVDTTRKDLSLWETDRSVDPISSQILNEAMFEGAILLHLRHVSQRGWVADASQIGRRSGHGVKQHGEATVDLLFQQPPGRGLAVGCDHHGNRRTT